MKNASIFWFSLAAATLAGFGLIGSQAEDLVLRPEIEVRRIVALGKSGEDNVNVEDYAGLWSARPGLAIAMAVFMLALLGFPIFGGIGFFAKWYVLQAAMQSPYPQTKLALVLVVTSAVGPRPSRAESARPAGETRCDGRSTVRNNRRREPLR